MTEEKFRELFAEIGWMVSYVDETDGPDRLSYDVIGCDLGRHHKGHVALTSGDAKIIAGTTYRRYGQTGGDEDDFRGLVFENAARDLSGEIRPDFDHWAFPGFLAGGDSVRIPGWLNDDGRCLVSSVEEFAFKLAALGPGENLEKPGAR